MSFSLDINTPVGQVRYLIGDRSNAPTPANFSDEEITGFLNLAGSVYLACALALEGLASYAAFNLTNIVLGSLKIDETSKVDALHTQAKKFRELDSNTPAWGVAEENLSSMNELLIIRNFILRNGV